MQTRILEIAASVILCGSVCATAETATGEVPPVTIVVSESSIQPVGNFAVGQLQKHLMAEGVKARIAMQPGASARGRVEMIVDPAHVNPPSAAAPESFRLMAGKDGSMKIVAADGTGLLWGVRDFTHYYCKDWLQQLRAGASKELDILSSPTIQNRGFWSWLYGCKDVYAYIDQASEWKQNRIIFWNRGVPMNADRLNEYAHERGVQIWWGFSFGWVAGDFADASPALAARLKALYEKQKAKIGPNLPNLCPQEPETPQALMDYVMDIYQRQYDWIPGIDGIYFQTATEVVCPCERCRNTPIGKSVMRTVLPIIEALHRNYPDLKISAGIHNKGEAYAALRGMPDYVNICWEAGAPFWANTFEDFQRQMTYRGPKEDFACIYRITMNCGMDMQGTSYGGEKDRVWLNRVDQMWEFIEEGKLPERKSKWPIFVNDKVVGYPCVSDWRPAEGQRLLDNKNFRGLLTWSAELAKGPPQTKGFFSLVEAGLIDLKMRRVPAMVAETIWNPLADQTELERRCRMIWEGRAGGWQKTVNPYWNGSNGESSAKGTPSGNVPGIDDPGSVYKQDPANTGK